MEKRKILILFVILSILVMTGCADISNNPTKGNETSNNHSDYKLGVVEHNKYVNKYFGFALNIPEGWSVKVYKASRNKKIDLLMISKNKKYGGLTYDTGISCVAVKIDNKIKSGADYLNEAKNILKRGSSKFIIDDKIRIEKVSGVAYYVMDAKLNVGKLDAKQRYYTRTRNGYAINYLLSYSTQAELDALMNILSTITTI